MTIEKKWPPGYGLLLAIALSAFLWGALGYVAWKWVFP